MRQVLLTADDINALNPQYASKLGYGRVNAYRALTPVDLQDPDARLTLNSFTVNDTLSGNGNGLAEKGETVQLYCSVQNSSIGSAKAAMIGISTSNPNIEFLNNSIGPFLFPADTTTTVKFDIKISENASVEQARLILTLESGQGYVYEETIEIIIGTETMPLLFVDDDKLLPNWPNTEFFFRDNLDESNLLYWLHKVKEIVTKCLSQSRIF